MPTIYVNKDQTLSLYTDNGKLIKDGFKNKTEIDEYINEYINKIFTFNPEKILTKKECEKIIKNKEKKVE